MECVKKQMRNVRNVKSVLMTLSSICLNTGKTLENVAFLENSDVSEKIDCMENVENDLATEFIDNYLNDIRDTSVHLEIESLENLGDNQHPFNNEEISREFFDDLVNEMTVDEKATRIRKSTEDGLGRSYPMYLNRADVLPVMFKYVGYFKVL